MLGAGTQSNPYIIETPQDLNAIRNNLTAYYELANDIDMSGWGNWNPISYYNNVTWVNGFSGNFDGKGYKIKNLTINKNDGGIYLGLFGQFFNGVIQNVGLENVNINNGGSGNNRLAGALVGYAYNATIKNCYITGGSIKAQDETGGLIGKAWQCTIENSFANINITLPTTYYGGGFVGSVDSNTTIKNCYFNGNVSYTQTSPWNGISGFVGFVRNNTDVSFQNCFWDTQKSGQANPPKIGNPPSTVVTGVSGKTTSQMKTQSTYTGWDFSNIWSIQNDYPTLRVFGVPIVVKKETVSVQSFTNKPYSLTSKNQKSTKQLNTFLNAIQTLSERHTSTKRTVSTYLSQINTNATKSSRTVRSGTATVNTFIKPIHSFAYRESKTIKQLLSSIKPLHTNVSVLYPLNNKVVNACVSVIQNPSSISKVANRSDVRIIQNPSYSEVIK